MNKIIPSLILTAILTGCSSRTPENTAQQYCDSLLGGDFTAFKTLYGEDYQRYLNESTFKTLKPSTCLVDAVTPPYATIRYQETPDGKLIEVLASLYILPDGRIKYDPIFVGHPALALHGLLSQMENDDIRFRQSAFRTLTNWNLPLFGFTPVASPDERAHSTAQFRHWVEKNEDTFDLGKVKIPVSPLDQERIEKAAHNK